MMYRLVACTECIHSAEVKMVDCDDVIRFFVCHNRKSKEYGIVHADFFECRLATYEGGKDFLTK